MGSNLFRKGRLWTRLVDFGLFHLRALGTALTLPRQDLVVCLTTPPFIGVVGMLVKALRGSRYVQYEMDLYPDIAVALGTLPKGGLTARLLERVHRRMLGKADRVVVLGRVHAARDPRQGSARPRAKAGRGDALGRGPRRSPAAGRGTAVPSGWSMVWPTSSWSCMPATWDSAMTRTRCWGRWNACGTTTACGFVFVGGGRRLREIQEQVAARGYRHVLLLDYRPRAELAGMLAAADVHLITQAPGTSGLIVPSKLYGILAAGRTSIYVGPADTEIAYTLLEENVGTVLAPGDVDGLVAALDTYRNAAPTPGRPGSAPPWRADARVRSVRRPSRPWPRNWAGRRLARRHAAGLGVTVRGPATRARAAAGCDVGVHSPPAQPRVPCAG